MVVCIYVSYYSFFYRGVGSLCNGEMWVIFLIRFKIKLEKLLFIKFISGGSVGLFYLLLGSWVKVVRLKFFVRVFGGDSDYW